MTKQFAPPAKPFSSLREDRLKRTPDTVGPGQTTRFDHVAHHVQLVVPQRVQELCGRRPKAAKSPLGLNISSTLFVRVYQKVWRHFVPASHTL
jgi:hypothetical protein